MRSLILVLIVLFIIAPPVFAQEHNYKPPEGYVPNAETAIRIAEAVLLPIYGESIFKERPFVAKLTDGAWVVTGTLPTNKVGGVAVIEISKETGCILRVSHGK